MNNRIYDEKITKQSGHYYWYGRWNIGAAVAKIFAQEGAKVLITDIQEDKLYAVAEEILVANGIVAYMLQDVATEESWQKVTEKAVTLLWLQLKVRRKLSKLVESLRVEEIKLAAEVQFIKQ
ncbi:SDR family oxidoreductase [Sinomicrobium sp. M5D2P17]